MILASIWAIIGTGVAVAIYLEMKERHPTKTFVIAIVLSGIFWPVIIVSLLTMVLLRLADA